MMENIRRNAAALKPVPYGKKLTWGSSVLELDGKSFHVMPASTKVSIYNLSSNGEPVKGKVAFFNADTWKYRVILDGTEDHVVEVEACRLKPQPQVWFCGLNRDLDDTKGIVETYDEEKKLYHVYSLNEGQSFMVEAKNVRLSAGTVGTLVNYNIQPEHNQSSVAVSGQPCDNEYCVWNSRGEELNLVKPKNIRVDRIPGHYVEE